MLESFLSVNLRRCSGHRVRYAEVYKAFLKSLPRDSRPLWTRLAFTKALNNLGYRTGLGNQNKTFIINVTRDPEAKPDGELIVVGENRSIRRIDVE